MTRSLVPPPFWLFDGPQKVNNGAGYELGGVEIELPGPQEGCPLQYVGIPVCLVYG